jgi:DNA-binding transcriptional regulator GbsR (MarR family)
MPRSVVDVIPVKARSKATSQEDDTRALVEEFGPWFEQTGMPRMAGRVLGWLLVCDPPEQTLNGIADALQASMGSISTMTRMVEQIGLIERASIPGERRVRYRVRPYAWSRTWEDQLEKARNLEVLVDRALANLDDAGPEARHRLEVTKKFAGFYTAQLPRLIADWQKVVDE